MKRKNIILMLLLFPLVTIMCINVPFTRTGENYTQCSGTDYVGFTLQRSYESCSFTCDGVQVSIALADRELTKEELTVKYCTLPPTETPVAPPVPTDTPTSTPVPDPDPMLTGEITLCDTINHVLNLRIVEGYDAAQFSSLNATIGGQAMVCAVNASNATIYTCTLPSPQAFPAQIMLTGDGATLNVFSFDGSSCITPENVKDDAKDDSNDPSTPVDCIADPLSPQC
jgi:hypothetical protein